MIMTKKKIKKTEDKILIESNVQGIKILRAFRPKIDITFENDKLVLVSKEVAEYLLKDERFKISRRVEK